MNIIDISTIVAFIVLALIGFISGFGRSLRHFTKGVVGVIISIFVCAAFGGMILGTSLVNGWICALSEYFGTVSDILVKMHMAEIVFYLAMFLVVQLVRILVVKFIAKIFEADNAVMKVINRILGLIFVPAVVCVFVLLAFAVLALFEDTTFMTNLIAKLDGTFLLKLYTLNPIVLHV